MDVVFHLTQTDVSKYASIPVKIVAVVLLLGLVICILFILYCRLRVSGREVKCVGKKCILNVGNEVQSPHSMKPMRKHSPGLRLRVCYAMLRRVSPEVCCRLYVFLPLALSIVSFAPSRVIGMVYHHVDIVRIWNATHYTERDAARLIREWRRMSPSRDASLRYAVGQMGTECAKQKTICIWLD